jgi:hypothetical protein
MTKWIKCSERLPENDGIYLTFNINWGCKILNEKNYSDGYSRGFMLRQYHSKTKMFTNKYGTKRVTHWQELEAPEEE